ncbi:hypothetical protein CEP52_004890 [Fusarium oligoseptatum]|uniref:Protein kinase domain-containing protein n=1 Tax=Fusarium oligoseptatum TaxID=2604345 RepID=A0A428U1J0_9HYPO|nr:hypothetical protein CEP52_004890 [Fusarium oligoseptatum]
MPVISSFIREPETDGLNIDLACLDLDNVDKTTEDDSSGLTAPPETLSLVSFVDTLDVKQENLGDIKLAASRGRPEPGYSGPAFGQLPSEYIIGTGVSSTVMLLTPPEDIQPLRALENICKLKHIAWEDTSVLPILGLEFAHFGTLEDCLQDLRSYSSVARKSHLSLDIALGVAAIHSAGLVHGDLKPRNILVTRHASRDVVAQISDLTGVAAASSYGATEFAIGTPTWQSPEALRRHQDTDWQLTDVYSFGMVVATLWSAEGFIPPGGTFLDPHMQYQFDTDTKRRFIESVKLMPDEDEGIVSTLCRHQRNRKQMQDVLTDCFLPWAQAVGRDTPHLSTTATENQPSPACWNDNLVNAINVEYSSLTHRSAAFQANFFRALLAAGEEIKKSLPVDKLADLEEHTPYRGEELSRHINLIRSNIRPQSHRTRRIASALRSLSSSYIWGRGVDVDEQVGLEWYALAARLGNPLDQFMFCLLEEIAERRLSAELPRKLWCAIAMFDHGDVAASKYLKDNYPGLYASVEMSARMNRWSITNRLYISAMGEPNLQMGSSNVEIVHQRLDPYSVYGEDQRTALHLCAMAGEKAYIEYLLLEKQANINAITTANETPIFHAVRGGNLQVAKSKGVDPLPILSDLDNFDCYTALHRAIYHDARDIFLFLLKTFPSLVNIPTRNGFTPLHSAAMKTWPGYARELLSHDANPYAEVDDGFTPFEQALGMNPDSESAKEIADLIYRNSERYRLLGPSQEGKGLTAFDSLLPCRKLTADRVEWLVQKCGKVSSYRTLSLRKPIFVYLSTWKGLPSHKVANAQNAAVLETLVKTFSTEINDYGYIDENTRRTPLQLAASRDAHRCARRNQGDWPKMMPWEGNGVSPLEDNVMETTRHNGLSMVSTLQEFMILDSTYAVATGQRGQPGHYVQPTPEPPNGFGGQLQTKLKEGWENWKSTL